jgi:hypothetical protein
MERYDDNERRSDAKVIGPSLRVAAAGCRLLHCSSGSRAFSASAYLSVDTRSSSRFASGAPALATQSTRGFETVSKEVQLMCRSSLIIFVLAVLIVSAVPLCVFAEENAPAVPAPAEVKNQGDSAGEKAAQKVVEYGGGVSVIPDEHTVILKGRTCVAGNEALEWAVVLTRGKDYESVVEVDADASMIQFALIALGYEAGGGVDKLGDPRTPTGDGLIIEVEWELGGKKTHCRIEELIWEEARAVVMEKTPFIFTGSKMVTDPATNKTIFMANSERLVAALCREPAAILNNPLNTGVEDTFYIAHTKTLPPKGTPVTVFFKPAPKKSAPNQASPAPAEPAPATPPPAEPVSATPPPAEPASVTPPPAVPVPISSAVAGEPKEGK